ncbi:MAG: hypothetical protein KA248_07110 [Kiritimatiellae bacterium]|nr:hypothetical protein [Kiritimatiellia bacterium]
MSTNRNIPIIFTISLTAILLGALPCRAEEGARAAESIWAAEPAPAAAPAPAAPDFSAQIAKLEQAVAELEKLLGSPRGIRARQPFEKRLGDLETRLDKIEKRLNDLETRLRRQESRK